MTIVIPEPRLKQQLDREWIEAMLAAVQEHVMAVTREIINGREPNAIVTSLPAADEDEYLWLFRMSQRLGAMRRSFALPSETAAASDQMVITSLNDAIDQIDSDAHSILDGCAVGMGRDPATMYAEDREEYERLLTLSKRARCAMTMLGIG